MAVELSRDCWVIYNRFTWQDKKIIGDQFITAVDSAGANIAEGYGRFHYLDRIKFYYNSRGSLFETRHWLLLLRMRSKISSEEFESLMKKANDLHRELNVYIKSCYPKK
jgi:four helix bundle protein